MKAKINAGFAPLLIIFIVLAVVVGGGAYYLGKQNRPLPFATPSPTATPAGIPTSLPTSTPASGWKTYTNEQYGFQISYPPTYQALTDAENLYGWPKAVALLYNGGQAYDLAIEIWNSQAEYESKHGVGNPDLTVKKIGEKFITVLDSTHEADSAAIITTLKATE